MPYKDLEHEGDEDFFQLATKNRKQQKEKEQKDKENQPTEEETFNRLQEAWLHPENPFLWEGDF